MKEVPVSDALRKIKKNVRKVFGDDHGNELHRIISQTAFKSSMKLYDAVTFARPVVADPDANLITLFQTVLHEVNGVSLMPVSLSQDALELTQLLSTPHMRCMTEVYTEIATRHYHMPELCESGPYATGMYSTLGSLVLSPSSHLLPNAQSTVDFTPNLYRSTNDTSRSMILVSGPINMHDLRMNGATLTGGGAGTVFPPVEGTMKMIGIEKGDGEDLGVTMVEQHYTSAHYGLVKELVIKRIMAGSKIEQQGLLHEGDVIREVNGVPVDNPESLQKLMRMASGTINMKIIPSYVSSPTSSQLFLRAHFSYNPEKDSLIPCKEAGISFHVGDVLQVLKQEDPYWWQARHYEQQSRAGLIPSVLLQERRRAFMQSAPDPEELGYKLLACGLARRRRKKVMVSFRAREANTYESKDLVLYEEVALIPGFQRPVIYLLGAEGVGRRTLCRLLIQSNPGFYAKAIPHTSRERLPEEVDDDLYYFEKREIMEMDNLENKYIEFGEFDGHYYGIKYDTIHQIVSSGRTCLLDGSPHVVRVLRTAEFMPYVVLVAAPSVSCMKAMYEYGVSMGLSEKWKRDEDFRRTVDTSRQIERNYRHLIDSIILCDNMESAFEKLLACLNGLLIQLQWVPARWLY